jgi:integrase
MASLQERNGSYRILFCHHGKQHAFTLGKVEHDEAENKVKQADYLLMRLKQRLVTLPDGVDIVTFIEHDGQPPNVGPTLPRSRKVVVLGHLKDRYLSAHSNGTIEANSLYTCRLHLNHFVSFWGEGLPVGELTTATLQDYVNHRAKAKISPVTIRKELATLRAAWNWGETMELTEGKFPNRGLRYPKSDEKPPFMTMSEIERQIKAGADKSLWETLYLQTDELTELLAHVKEKAIHPWIYPLFCFAAHTGARRSEIVRAIVADIDFSANIITIHEKKRDKSQRTTRRVPLTPFLKKVLKDWLDIHPGGASLFCYDGEIPRSKKRSRTTGHLSQKKRPSTLKGRMATVSRRQQPETTALTCNEVHDHFRRVLTGSKWENIPGLHCLRHSFISACATKGVDQRLVQEWAGHMNEATSRRYRHLYPSSQQEAIKSVFK